MATRFQEIIAGCASAALATPYQQSEVMPMHKFERYLKERDCELRLADLWQLGVLRPVLIDGPLVEPLRREGMVHVRTPIETDHEHFADARPMPSDVGMAGEGDDSRSEDMSRRAWYHPFQILQAYRAARRFGQGKRMNRHALEAVMRSWELVDAARLVTLLISVAPLVMPWISGRVMLRRTLGESYEDFWTWRRGHNPQHLMSENGFTEEDLCRWHADAAREAYLLDPLREWFDLTRNISWDAWERVKGKVRLAHDIYTVAETVRLYSGKFLLTELPEEDEVCHGPRARMVKENLYGHPRVTDRRRDVRRRVAREFGLDGGIRVVWFVEGETEKGFILRYGDLTGYQCDSRGIAVNNLRGSGSVRGKHLPRMRERLDEAKREEQFSYVTLDSLPDRSAELRQLARDGLITGGFRKWRGDFEGANFTDDELAAMVTEMAGEASVDVRMDAEAIKRERERGAATHEAMKRCLRGQRYEPESGEKWGHRLAKWAVEHSCPEEIAENGDRPVVALLWHLFRACSAEFRGSILNYRVDDDGKIVEREKPPPVSRA